jgi:hypothetical protein
MSLFPFYTFCTTTLQVNPLLPSINLWRNNIGPKGATSLAEALKANTSLR